MGLASEFKEFAMKGNVVDLAVGVIIGAAFGKIVSSMVGDVFMPALGKVIGGFKYGAFIQTAFDFAIIAIVLFMCIKGINKLKKPAPPAAATPAPPPRSEVLLEEIRDLLAKRA